MNNCPKCGAQLTAGDDFCKMCGTRIGGNMPVNNGYNPGVVTPPQANYFPPQKQANPNMKYICITIAVVALVIGGIFITNKMFSSKPGTQNPPSTTGNGKNGGGNGGSTEVATSGSKMRYGDFTLVVPDNISVEEGNDSLVIYDEGNWSAMFSINPVVYTRFKNNQSSLKTQLMQSGYTDIKDFEIKNINEKEVLYTTAIVKGYLDQIGFVQVANRFTAIFEAFNDADPTVLNTKMLDSIVAVLKTIEYDPSTRNLEGNDILSNHLVINTDEFTEEDE